MSGLILFLLIISLIVQVSFLLRMSRWPTKRQNRSNEPLPVSVVIAARNEADNLLKLIPDLLAQEHPDFEVIISDNGSQDSTSEIVRQFDDPRICMLSAGEAERGWNNKKWALEKGISASKFSNLVLIDADVRIPSVSWLSSMSREFNEADVVLGVSPYMEGKGFLNKFIRFETLYTAFMYTTWAMNGKPFMGVGRNLGYKKEIFEKFGGFEGIQSVKGGDDDLFVNRIARKVKVSVATGEDTLVWTYPKRTLKDFMYQKWRHLSVGGHYRAADRARIAAFILTHIGLYIFGLFLIATGFVPLLVILAWTIRYLFFIPAFKSMLSRFGLRFRTHYLIILDFVYPLYYISAAFGAARVKNIPWKTKDSSRTKLSKISA